MNILAAIAILCSWALIYLLCTGRPAPIELTTTTAPGGFDGFVLAFAEGTDLGTVQSLLPPTGWCVNLTFSDHPRASAVYFGGVDWDQDEGAIVGWYPHNPEDTATPPILDVWDFDTLTGITVL